MTPSAARCDARTRSTIHKFRITVFPSPGSSASKGLWAAFLRGMYLRKANLPLSRNLYPQIEIRRDPSLGIAPGRKINLTLEVQLAGELHHSRRILQVIQHAEEPAL